MNKEKFMAQLESLLSPISAPERELALQYYINYFEDAGDEKEEEVIEELGSPEDVAKIIFEEVGYKEEIANSNIDQTKDVENESVKIVEENVSSSDDNFYSNSKNTNQTHINEETNIKKEKSEDTGKIILAVTAVLWGPVWLALILTIAVGLIPTVSILVLVFSLLAVIFAVLGIGLFLGGIMNLFTVPAFGISLIGASLVLLAVAILFVLIVWLFASIVIPALVKLLTWICLLPFKSKGDK